MRKEFTVTVKNNEGKKKDFLFFTKKDMEVFLKRCKAMKLSYTIKELAQ